MPFVDPTLLQGTYLAYAIKNNTAVLTWLTELIPRYFWVVGQEKHVKTGNTEQRILSSKYDQVVETRATNAQ